MHVAVTGGSGFIGKHLVNALLKRGDEVTVISRGSSPARSDLKWLTWTRLESHPEELENVGGIVSLAGESINQRWTDAAKRRIVLSRLDTADRLARALDAIGTKPDVIVNGSGMSIYGTSETDAYTEKSPGRIVDFLSGVVRQWEEAADRIPAETLIKLRVGLVLGSDGGALPKMLLPYRMMVGGRLGSGRQWMSWIHIDDLVGLILASLDGSIPAGPLNGTAPHPVRSDEFGRTAAKVLSRPHYFPVPAIAFQVLFGELSDLLLKGQCVLPEVALQAGYRFRFPELQPALENLLQKRP